MEQTTLPLPTLSALTGKKIDARFDGGRLSSDGGVVLLSEGDRRLKLCERLAGCLVDERDQTLVRHSMTDLVRAGSFAIAAGFEDGNDFALLRHDPALKLACGRLPETGSDLASQPTIGRFENTPDTKTLVALEDRLIAMYRDSFERVPARVVLDVDETFDVVHGAQQPPCSTATTTSSVISRWSSSMKAAGCFWRGCVPASDRAARRPQR